jgi:Tfp pilus assembly protein PilE
LIELMVVTAVVAVLAVATVPTWRGHVRRVHRTEAIQALLALAAAQERHHLRHGRYAAGLGAADDSTAERLPIAIATAGGRYRLAIDAGDEAGFSARAAAAGSQQEDRQCAVFGSDETGARTALDHAGMRSDAQCWR